MKVPAGTQTWAAPDGSVRVWPGDDPGSAGGDVKDGLAAGAEADGDAAPGGLGIAEAPADGEIDEVATDPLPPQPTARSIAIAAAPPSLIREGR